MKVLLKKILILTTLLFIAFGQAIAADGNKILMEEWSIDKSHSNINFSIRHFFTPVDGNFKEYTANIQFDPNDLENSSLDVTIPVSSINTENDRRDNDLRSDNFFNASEWPNITFESNSIEQTGENKFVAHGELTMRDVTKEFDLPFELLGIMDHPRRENTKIAGIVADATLNRMDYGVGTGNWATTAVVGDEVDIQIKLELHSTN